MTEIISLEAFLSCHNASRLDFGDPAMHKRAGANDTAWQRLIKHQVQKDAELTQRRERLTKVYNRLVAWGRIRPPTDVEKLLEIASGNPENQSVQAAQHVLAKRAQRAEGVSDD